MSYICPGSFNESQREADVASLLSEHEHTEENISVAHPDVPIDLEDYEFAEIWLTTPSTWKSQGSSILKHDLMRYRALLKRLVRCSNIRPIGALRSVSNYAWQYSSHQPHHALSTKETGAACLALAQSAALTHLPLINPDDIRSAEQTEISMSIMAVLDALQEGFPCNSITKRSEILIKLVTDEDAWHIDRTPATLASLLGGYLDSALE